MRTRAAFLLIAALAAFPPVITACAGSQKANAASVKPGNMPDGASWDGVYYNPVWGYLHLKHEGSNVKGRWKTADESSYGEMEGNATGDILRFSWSEHKVGMVGPSSVRKGKGYFRYTRPAGENVDDRLKGEWGFDESEVGGGEWDSVKQRNLKADFDQVKPEGEPNVGGWK